MNAKPRLFRGLWWRRTLYRPGYGVCRCSVCAAAVASHGKNWTPAMPAMGSPVEGCEYKNKEAAFAAQWAKEHDRYNDPSQGLLCRPPKAGDRRSLYRSGPVAWVLTYRDRIILATVIQWLGSNIGMHFLRDALGACGFEIIEKRIERD